MNSTPERPLRKSLFSLILLCKKPFSVEAVEHFNDMQGAFSASANSHASNPGFLRQSHTKVKGGHPCGSPPLLSEFSKIRFGTESQHHVISNLSSTCEPKPAFPKPTRYDTRCKRSLGSIALLSVARSPG